jgi:hypothetical protein
MRHAVLILAILCSFAPAGLGLFWWSQQAQEKEMQRKNKETINSDLELLPRAEVLDPSVRGRVQSNVDKYNTAEDILYRRAQVIPFLIATALLAVLGGVLAELRHGYSAAALLAVIIFGPPVIYQHAGMLCLSAPLLVPAILALFVGPAKPASEQSRSRPGDRRRRDEEVEDDRPARRRDRDEEERQARRRPRRRDEDADEDRSTEGD